MLGLVPTISLLPSINNQPGQEYLHLSAGLTSILCTSTQKAPDFASKTVTNI